ncbi:MAG: hypothetical protein ACK4J0_00510, partial [Candidatus Anstonellaceae archaeon]
MNNRTTGLLLFSVAVIIGVIIFLFNRALTEIVNTSCSHGPSCPMWSSIDFHTNLSLLLLAIVFVLSIYLIFFAKEEEKVITKLKIIKPKEQEKQTPFSKQKYSSVLNTLPKEEKIIFEKILNSQGAILQSDLINENEGYSKV